MACLAIGLKWSSTRSAGSKSLKRHSRVLAQLIVTVVEGQHDDAGIGDRAVERCQQPPLFAQRRQHARQLLGRRLSRNHLDGVLPYRPARPDRSRTTVAFKSQPGDACVAAAMGGATSRRWSARRCIQVVDILGLPTLHAYMADCPSSSAPRTIKRDYRMRHSPL